MADLEGGAELDAHGGHEVVSLQQHQGLAINLLDCEVLDIVTAARKGLDEVAHLLHVPLERVVLRTDRGLLGLLRRLLDNLLGLLDLGLGGERRADNGAHHSLAADTFTALKLLLRRLTAVDVVEGRLLLLFLLVDGAGGSARSPLDRDTEVGRGPVGGCGAWSLGLILL